MIGSIKLQQQSMVVSGNHPNTVFENHRKSLTLRLARFEQFAQFARFAQFGQFGWKRDNK